MANVGNQITSIGPASSAKFGHDKAMAAETAIAKANKLRETKPVRIRRC
jgi:hypothetical protein